MNDYDVAVRSWILDSTQETGKRKELAALPEEMLFALYPEFKQHGPQPIKMQRVLTIMDLCQDAMIAGNQNSAAAGSWQDFVDSIRRSVPMDNAYLSRAISVKPNSSNYYRSQWLRRNLQSDSAFRTYFNTTCSKARIATRSDLATILYLSVVDRTLGVAILPKKTIASIQNAYHKLIVAQSIWGTSS